MFRTLCVLFVIFAVASFFSGLQAEDAVEELSKISDDVIANHYQWGRIVFFGGVIVALFGALSIERLYEDRLLHLFYRISLLLLCAVTLYTGYLGGVLVFVHGAGVK